MVTQKENPYIDHFVAGFCNAGTPYSTRIFLSGKEVTNPLQIHAAKFMDNETINFWEDSWTESFCYFSGGLLGLTLIPIDALLTGVFTVKEKFVGIDK